MAGGVFLWEAPHPEPNIASFGRGLVFPSRRYAHLHGKHVLHPLDGRRIPIITDAELVDMSFGTGAAAPAMTLRASVHIRQRAHGPGTALTSVVVE